jgi:hypothetical protein
MEHKNSNRQLEFDMRTRTANRTLHLKIHSLPVAVGLLFLLSTFRAWSGDCVSPPAGLVSWWPGEGNANDIAGTNNGTLVGGVGFAPGEVGQAFTFDGSTGYVQVADAPSLHCTNALTVEAWVYPTSLGAYHEIVSKWAGGYTTSVEPDGRIYLSVYSNTLATSATTLSTTSVPPNQWTHFAATYDGSALRMYINGICENQVP